MKTNRRVSEQVKFIEGGTELADRMEPLWRQLNALHAEKSTHFAEDFENTDFSGRKYALEKRATTGKLRVSLAVTEANEEVGYCVSSICEETTPLGTAKVGEIESMFVLGSYRRLGIGRTFVTRSIEWFEENDVQRVIVVVAVGNEEVLDFYKAAGLLPRAIQLERKRNVRATDPDKSKT